jgi:hypothetical protein
MSVRQKRVSVVRSNPFEARFKVLFHSRHETPNQGPQIFILGSVVGSDQEPKMMPVTGAALNEGTSVRVVAISRIQPSGLALAARPVSQYVSKVRAGSVDFASPSHHPAFHEDVPRAKPAKTLIAHKAASHDSAPGGPGALETRPVRARAQAGVRFGYCLKHRSQILPVGR